MHYSKKRKETVLKKMMPPNNKSIPQISQEEDMDIPGWRLHILKGDYAGLWAVNVSGNWRVVFEFKDGHVYVVNYEDYH